MANLALSRIALRGRELSAIKTRDRTSSHLRAGCGLWQRELRTSLGTPTQGQFALKL